MNGAKLLLDTNIIIYHLSGSKNIELILDDSVLYISSLTSVELLSAQTLSKEEEQQVKEYIDSVHIIHTNNFICEVAADLRKTTKLKLPDALIAATGLFLNIPLVTFDSDFDNINDIQIIKLKF